MGPNFGDLIMGLTKLDKMVEIGQDIDCFPDIEELLGMTQPIAPPEP